MIDLRPLQEKIHVVYAYLREHFEDSLSPSHKARFYLTFSDVDRASVRYRSDAQIVISYRLAFLPGGAMEWRGRRRSGVRAATIKVERAVAKE